MPLQIRRGTEAERTTITPVVGEPLYTTDGKKLFIGDGSTAGGVQIGTGTVTSITPAADIGSGSAITTSGTLSILGTTNEVNTLVSGTTVIVGLPDYVAVTTVSPLMVDYNLGTGSVTPAVARQYWDTTYNTLTLGLSANVDLKQGQALYKRARNDEAVQITKGQVVYVSGSHAATEAKIKLASADAESTSANVIGVAAENIAANSTGFVQVFGYLTGLNTVGYTGSEGSALYLSSTAGALTSTLPVAPKHGNRIAFLVKKAGSPDGSIFINIQNYQELEELSDVFVSAPAANHALLWDSVDQRWENSAITLSKLGSITAFRLVGRNNATSGSPEEISLGTGLKMSGTVLSANTSDVVSTATSITAGTGLTGGVQTLASNVSIGVDFGSGVGKVCQGNDARLSDARTPTTHKTSHATGGTDAIAPADIGAAAATHVHSGADITSGTVGLAYGGTGTTLASTGGSKQYLKQTTTGGAVTVGTIAMGDLGTGTADSTTYLRGDGTWATVSATGGGTKTYAVFTPLDAQPPATNFATLDTRNNIAVLEFDGAATDEATTFVGIMPEGASLGSGLKVYIHWMADTATSGNVRWGVQFERMNTNLGSDSFDTATEGNSAANGTSGIPSVLELTCTTIDGITAGDAYRIKVYREASDTGNDTMSGDAQLIAVEVRSAA